MMNKNYLIKSNGGFFIQIFEIENTGSELVANFTRQNPPTHGRSHVIKKSIKRADSFS